MAIKIAIMMSNYFHDLATALLATSGIIVFVLARAAEKSKDRNVVEYFVTSYEKLTWLGRGAFAWILAAGVIRTLAFEQYEWAEAVGKDQVPALIVKHVFMFTVVGVGIFYWRRLNGKVKKLKDDFSLGSGSAAAEPLEKGSAATP